VLEGDGSDEQAYDGREGERPKIMTSVGTRWTVRKGRFQEIRVDEYTVEHRPKTGFRRARSATVEVFPPESLFLFREALATRLAIAEIHPTFAGVGSHPHEPFLQRTSRTVRWC
jgi:hypothetical protein